VLRSVEGLRALLVGPRFTLRHAKKAPRKVCRPGAFAVSTRGVRRYAPQDDNPRRVFWRAGGKFLIVSRPAVVMLSERERVEASLWNPGCCVSPVPATNCNIQLLILSGALPRQGGVERPCVFPDLASARSLDCAAASPCCARDERHLQTADPRGTELTPSPQSPASSSCGTGDCAPVPTLRRRG
jgi:hypothetical protein